MISSKANLKFSAYFQIHKIACWHSPYDWTWTTLDGKNMSAEKIIERIKKDSEKEINSILKEAEKETIGIVDSIKKVAKLESEKIITRGVFQGENIKKILISKAIPWINH